MKKVSDLIESIDDVFLKALEEKMDPVGKEDDDVDNDGDVDSSDKYLKKRRASVAAAIAKQKDESSCGGGKKSLKASKSY